MSSIATTSTAERPAGSPGRLAIELPFILAGGTFAVLLAVEGSGVGWLSAALSFVGCSAAAFVPTVLAFAFFSVLRNEDDRFPSRRLAVPLVISGVLGAGLYYLVHRVVAIPVLDTASRMLGAAAVFVGAWALWTVRAERRRQMEQKTGRLDA